MSWRYSQTSGELRTPAGTVVGIGYSGHGSGLNNPAMQQVENVGPIPRGEWRIGAFFDDPGGKGPMVAHLTPVAAETFGRDGFMIHGDNEAMDHSASEGCIVLPRGVRQMLMTSEDRSLIVTE